MMVILTEPQTSNLYVHVQYKAAHLSPTWSANMPVDKKQMGACSVPGNDKVNMDPLQSSTVSGLRHTISIALYCTSVQSIVTVYMYFNVLLCTRWYFVRASFTMNIEYGSTLLYLHFHATRGVNGAVSCCCSAQSSTTSSIVSRCTMTMIWIHVHT